ncbi:complex I NDUFA9 subunit family protein [Roseiterribacter gracilis]|uniref:3-beta-hydroxy-Delta(5)-steroid dehydrogenase n=1 Tax=Roseiterribacter gracilis TaxID=2812848 RepID=A0A8S8XAR7_9PROT|nr:3-beta-hydroxy-Delta(5)-steroid dehydrogenase [Rhodospirillales bacterium TMPK1]
MTYKTPVATIFGGTGFVGRHTLKKLAGSEMVIRVATRSTANAARLRTGGVVGQVVPMLVDPYDDRLLAAAIDGADIVVNLVGTLTTGGFKRAHAELPGRIGAAAKRAGVQRVVHVSSIGADPNAASRYAASKGEGEVALRQAFADATILRPSVVFGPEDNFFNRFAMLASFVPMLPLIGGGKTRFQPVWVGDVAQSIANAVADDNTRGRTFELGGPSAHSFEELMQLMLKTIRREGMLLPIPFGIAALAAKWTGWLPGAPLSSDQVEQLRHDNVVQQGAATLKDLGIEATSLEQILPTYLNRYRKGGQFADIRDYSVR